MSILKVVAVQDRAMQAFGRPLFVPSHGVAMRSFSDEVNRAAPDNQMSLHPEDFELWSLCEFDEESGAFVNPGLSCLSRGKDCVIRKESGNGA